MNRQTHESDTRQLLVPDPANYRRRDLLALRFYPPLLLLATVTAAAFCVLYLRKPTTIVVQAVAGGAPRSVMAADRANMPDGTNSPMGPEPAKSRDLPSAAPSTNIAPATPPPEVTRSGEIPLLPAIDHLPGEANARPANGPAVPREAPGHSAGSENPSSSASSPNVPTSRFVPTSLTVRQTIYLHPPAVPQGVSTTLEFPVFHRAGTLRWSDAQRARCEELLQRLKSHQQECLRLRVESAELLDAWNAILRESSPIPAVESQPAQP